MLEISTNITTGRVTISPNMTSVENTVTRGFVSVSMAGIPNAGGGGHSPSILMESTGYILMETLDTILLE